MNQNHFKIGKRILFADQQVHDDKGSKKPYQYLREVLQYVQNQPIGPIVGSRHVGCDEINLDPEGYSGEYVNELLSAVPVKETKKNINVPSDVVESLLTTGLAVWRQAVSMDFVFLLRKTLENSSLEMSRDNHGQDNEIRTDKIGFVKLSTTHDDDCEENDGSFLSPTENENGDGDLLTQGFDILNSIAAQVNGTFGFNLLRPPVGMVSEYSATGTSYKPHFDNERNSISQLSNFRVLTTILYLNELDWSEHDGGYLECVLPGNNQSMQIRPSGGTVVLFDSQTIKHQVLPCFRDRFAMTQWFVSDDLLNDKMPPAGPLIRSWEQKTEHFDEKQKPSVLRAQKTQCEWNLQDSDKGLDFSFF